MTISSTGLAAVLLGAGTLVMVPSTAHAAPTTTRTIEVRAEYTEPMPGFDGVECRGLDAPSPWCQGVFAGPVTFTGTIAGVAYAESAGPTTTGHTYDGPDAFERAVVKGCGVGGLIFDTFDGDFDFTDTRASDVSTGGYNKWRIRPGSGTGTLAGISGEGENHWRPYWTETGDRWGRGVFTGTITCQVPRKTAPSPRTETRTVKVRSELRAPLSTPAGVSCRGVATGDPWCQARFSTEVTLTGTMSGTGTFPDAGPTPDGHHAAGAAVFERVKIAGCGEGATTFDAVTDFDFADTRPDLSSGAHETWTLRRGTGTRGLAGVIGGDLVNDWRAYWSDGQKWARGTVTGTITCAVPVNEGHAKLRVATAPTTDPELVAVLGATFEPVGQPTVAVLDATFEPAAESTRMAGAAAVALAGVALLGVAFVRRLGETQGFQASSTPHSRYPAPGSVRSQAGFAGSSSISRRRWLT